MASKPTRISSLVKVRWLDPPSLYPGDIRSRHMVIELDPSITSNHDDRVIWRSKFSCNRCCERLPPEKQEQMEVIANPEEEVRAYAALRRRAMLVGSEDSKIDTTPPPRDRTAHVCRARLIVSSEPPSS